MPEKKKKCTFIHNRNELSFPATECHHTLAITHFPLRLEGWVVLSGWSQTEEVYPPAGDHPSQYYLGPVWSNFIDRDQCATTKPNRHSAFINTIVKMKGWGQATGYGSVLCVPFSALTLMMGWHNGHPERPCCFTLAFQFQYQCPYFGNGTRFRQSYNTWQSVLHMESKISQTCFSSHIVM